MLFLHGSSLTIQSSQFGTNCDDSIVSILQSKESIDVGQVNSQNSLIDNVTANEYGNTFLLIQNQTNDDSVMITYNEFGSSNLEYIIYATSDEITRIESANNHSALLWTSNDNDTNTTGVQDDNNGKFGLELTVTSDEFNIRGMNGLFGHLYNAPDVTNQIVFVDNMFVNYNDSGASDYMMNFDTEGTKVNITLDNNERDNLVVSQFIGTNGSVWMYHTNMNVSDNSNYLVSKNSSIIIQFEHLNGLMLFTLFHTQIDEICVLLLDLITLMLMLCYCIL